MTNAQTELEVQEWYEVEVSAIGADDWFAVAGTYDTLKSVRSKLDTGHIRMTTGHEHRIVRKRLTSEVVA